MTRLACLFLLLACRKEFRAPTDTALLPIPDRQWEAGAPDEGWCGETSIQMVALHYGIWAPQPVINSLGRSTHVDLWEEDVPVAMTKLGLVYERAQAGTRDEFINWIIGQLRAGHPVIVGAKLFPSDHPEWDVDHLMPVVGFSPRGLTFDTNMDPGQEELPYSALGGHDGISFVSPTGKFYGFAVTGTREGGPRVTLRVLEESADSLKLAVHVEGSAPFLRRDNLDGGVSTSPKSDELTISRSSCARFTSAAAAGPSSPSP